jgi:hypothetical protein
MHWFEQSSDFAALLEETYTVSHRRMQLEISDLYNTPENVAIFQRYPSPCVRQAADEMSMRPYRDALLSSNHPRPSLVQIPTDDEQSPFAPQPPPVPENVVKLAQAQSILEAMIEEKSPEGDNGIQALRELWQAIQSGRETGAD